MDGRTSRWEAHNDAQRLRIVEAAISLYDEGRVGATLQEIGERAGVSRSVVYRQFADRRDLESAVQRHILEDLWSLLAPVLLPQGTIRQTLRRAAATYVEWAAAHPRLHQLADLDMAADGPLQQAIDQISATIAGVLVTWFEAGGARISAEDRAATDPLAHGLVGAVFATVRRWVHLGAEVPAPAQLTDLLVDAAWAVIAVRAHAYGLAPDPDLPLERLLVRPGER